MVLLLAVLITLAALAALAYPILRRDRATPSSSAIESTLATASVGALPYQEQLAELLAQRDAAVQALRELSFDRQVGKISDDDFTAFETNLRLTAAGTYRALDEWEVQSDSRLGPSFAGDVATRVELLRSSQVICGSCGRPALSSDKFCSACGAMLEPAAPPPATIVTPVCPHCGSPAAPGDRFCAACGKPLVEASKALAG